MMSVSRRQALGGLAASVALALSPFRVEAQSPGFGVLVEVIGETITQSANVISAVTEQLDKAVTSGIDIYDKIQLRALQHTLVKIKAQMISLNGKKRANIEAFKDYLNKDLLADDWQTLQRQCKDISMELDALLVQLGNDKTVLVRDTAFATAGDLKAALIRQSSIYLRLSTLGEPSTDQDRDKLAAVIDQLNDLLNKVIALENSIGAYLNKFPNSP